MTEVSFKNDDDATKFWQSHFGTLKEVPLEKFTDAFVKEFQTGKDGRTAYPALVLFTIIYHLILLKRGYSECPTTVTVHAFTNYLIRFGSFYTSVDTICENLLDANGELHSWYHLKLESREALVHFSDKDHSQCGVTDVVKGTESDPHYTGTMYLILHNAKRGNKRVMIEQIRDAKTGKVSFGIHPETHDSHAHGAADTQSHDAADAQTHGAADAHSKEGEKKEEKEVEPFKEGLIAWLKERTADYDKPPARHWGNTHRSSSNRLRQEDDKKRLELLWTHYTVPKDAHIKLPTSMLFKWLETRQQKNRTLEYWPHFDEELEALTQSSRGLRIHDDFDTSTQDRADFAKEFRAALDADKD